MFSDKSKISDKLLSEVRQAISKENEGVAMWDFQKSSLQGKKISPDYASRLSEISVPTLFFHGDRDPGVPLADSQNAVKLIEDAKLHVMRNCKHWSQKERPEEYCRVLQDFINQLNSSSIIARS